MKIKQSKEWFLRMAELEEGCDISAGKPVFFPSETLILNEPPKPQRKPRSPSAGTKKTLKKQT